MFNLINILAEGETTGGKSNSWVFLVVIAALFVVMILFTYIPQKKRQKQFKDMQESLKVGDKIMTIGRLIGTVKTINDDNTIIINLNTDEEPTLVKIDKDAVGVNLTYQAAVQAQQAAAAAAKSAAKIGGETKTEESSENISFEGNTNDLSLDKTPEDSNKKEDKKDDGECI